MCPACLTTAAMFALSLTSTGGLAAIAIRKFSVKNDAGNQPAPSPSELSRKENGA